MFVVRGAKEFTTLNNISTAESLTVTLTLDTFGSL